MTYLEFHLVFLLPPIATLLVLAYRRGVPHGAWRAIGLTTLIAFVYTTPWDNYLVYAKIWWYGPERVLATIGYVPVEEYAFFLLQPLLTGLFYVLYFSKERSDPPIPALGIAGIFLALGVWGGFLLVAAGPTWTYLGLILAWACPVVAAMWAFAAPLFSIRWRAMLPAILIPTVYLWFADWTAIDLEIWTISLETSTGWMPFGLPIEEATFFLLTNILVITGISLFMHGDQLAALRRATRRAHPNEVSSTI